ncbi:MAG: hypothetical protein ACXVCV_24065, partial [Polyangia bacterium]
EVNRPSRVADLPPPSPSTPGHSHVPYTGVPKYLASSRPMQATTSGPRLEGHTPKPEPGDSCAMKSRACEERLRAVLAALDGEVLALSAPPTELQLSALRLQVAQLQPLLAPYTDITAEAEELGNVVAKLPFLPALQQSPARRRLIELTDLIRVQLAAGE